MRPALLRYEMSFFYSLQLHTDPGSGQHIFELFEQFFAAYRLTVWVARKNISRARVYCYMAVLRTETLRLPVGARDRNRIVAFLARHLDDEYRVHFAIVAQISNQLMSL